MVQCCGCDLLLFSTQQAVKTHISLKIKINKGELVLGKLASAGLATRTRPQPGPGPRPGPGPGQEDSYFHRGLHNVSWPGPGYIIVNLGSAAAAAGRGGGGSCCPPAGQLVGWWSCHLTKTKIFSETDSSSDSESESSADQDPPEKDPASESETSLPADPGEKYCEIL